MTKFIAFMGHDDASRVTPQDIIRFKDHRLATGASAKTVKDSDLAALKTLFGWAKRNHKVAANPAEGITIKVGKKAKLRSKGFTEAEAVAVLRHATTYDPGQREDAKLSAAKKWVPWLCAFTGARVGEILQLRKQDVRLEGEHWVVHITPEAGTVKTNEARDAAIHDQLIDLGFLDFAKASKAGHLFVSPRSADGDVLKPIKTARNKLGTFVREVVQDPNVAPNHGWRHRFKTVGMEQGIPNRVLDAIQGQAPSSVADTYGEVTIKARAQAVAKFPRYAIG